MDTQQLQWLLGQPESTTLEFKQELYQIDHSDKKVVNLHRDELIKDILSLANGNAATVEDNAYLIIGAENTLQPDGTRKLIDIDASRFTRQRVLEIINKACTPRLQDIEFETIELEGNHILVITIWPTPHLHETTRELTTAQSHYSEHVVFIRNNENIAIASAKEREAILKLKQIYFAETRKAPPARLGAFVGAVVGGFMTGAAASQDKSNPPSREELTNKMIAGSVVGAPIGGFIGWSYTNFLDFRYQWHFLSKRQRFVVLVAYIGTVVALSRSVLWVWRRLQSLLTERRKI